MAHFIQILINMKKCFVLAGLLLGLMILTKIIIFSVLLASIIWFTLLLCAVLLMIKENYASGKMPDLPVIWNLLMTIVTVNVLSSAISVEHLKKFVAFYLIFNSAVWIVFSNWEKRKRNKHTSKKGKLQSLFIHTKKPPQIATAF